jgi:predicted DNA binding CopG/RHH family protein
MSTGDYANIEAHEGRPVGIKVELDFSPDEARRLTELAAAAGLPLTQYIKRVLEETAAARAR